MSMHGEPEERAMDHALKRRTFLKAAGAATAFMIAESASAFSYARNSKVRIGCIGVGAQGARNVREGLTHTPDAQIVAIAEVYKPNQDAAINLARLSNAKRYVPEGQPPSAEQQAAAMATPAPVTTYDYREVLANPNVDAVIISTPPREQFQIVIDALDAGRYVFCDTPLVRSVEQGRYLVEKCHKLGRWVQVGYQHRYNPKYNLAQSLVYEKVLLGRITHISAQSHRNAPERIPPPKGYVLNGEERKHVADLDRHLNWRLYRDQSRGLYTGAALHHIDAANWFLRSVPARVFASGGLDYWQDGGTNDDNVVIICEYDIGRSSPGFIGIRPRTSLMNEVSANQPYTVRFVCSSVLNSSTRGVCELVQGDQGSLALGGDGCKFFPERWRTCDTSLLLPNEQIAGMSASEMDQQLKVCAEDLRFRSGCTRCPTEWYLNLLRRRNQGISLLDFGADLDPKVTPSASAEALQLRAFTDSIANAKVPCSNEMVAFTSALTSLAALESRRTGQPITLDPGWSRFDFESPCFYGYDASWINKTHVLSRCECCGQPKLGKEVDSCPVCGREVRLSSVPPCPC
jgi:predicted dehydrogenase